MDETTETGRVLTDDDFEKLADEAEKGYDVSHLVKGESLDFADLRRVNAARVDGWHEDLSEEWTCGDWGTALGGEAGEALNVLKKIRRLQTGVEPMSDQALRELVEHLGEELADVVIYADLVARLFDLDLARCVRIKFNADSNKRGIPQFQLHDARPRTAELEAELEAIYEAARQPGDAALFNAVKHSEARMAKR